MSRAAGSHVMLSAARVVAAAKTAARRCPTGITSAGCGGRQRRSGVIEQWTQASSSSSSSALTNATTTTTTTASASNNATASVVRAKRARQGQRGRAQTVHRQSEQWRPPGAPPQHMAEVEATRLLRDAKLSRGAAVTPIEATTPWYNESVYQVSRYPHPRPEAMSSHIAFSPCSSSPSFSASSSPRPPSSSYHHPTAAATLSSSSTTSSSAGRGAPYAAFPSAGQRLLISYHDLEEALERRGVRGVRFVLAFICAVAAGIGVAWPRIKQWGAVEGAEVAAASLEDEQLQAKISGMVRDVLQDADTVKHVEQLLKVAIANILRDPEMTATATEWTADVLYEAVMKEALVKRGTQYVSAVLNEQESVDAAESFLADSVKAMVKDEKVQDSVASVSDELIVIYIMCLFVFLYVRDLTGCVYARMYTRASGQV